MKCFNGIKPRPITPRPPKPLSSRKGVEEEMKPMSVVYECINDECRAIIFGFGKHMDGLNCPRCGGPVIPIAYEPKSSNTSNRVKPLLEIAVTDLNSVPVVKYKGETITHLDHVNYNWSTRTDKESGSHSLHLKHYYSDDCDTSITRTVDETRC